MKAAAILLARFALASTFALSLTACVTNANRCFPGYEYAPQYDVCLALDAGAAPSDSGTDAPTTDAAPSEAGSNDGDGGASGLGTSCNADSDCTGAATYCLKDPTNPTAPGICSFTHCTAAACTSAYSCCDCSAAILSALQAFPPGVCIPTGTAAQVTSLGCQCQAPQ